MSDLVKLRGDWHAETLANGRTIAPGEPFDRADLDPTDVNDKRLLDEGLLIDAVITPDADASAADVRQRARDLNIEGRSSMSPDELREAVALAEAEQVPPPAAGGPIEEPQIMGGGS